MAVSSKELLLGKVRKWRKDSVRQSLLIKGAAISVYFILGFITGCVRIFDSINPFGVAMTACCGGGVGGLMSLLGSALGYILYGEPLWSVRYLAALVMVYTLTFILRGNEWVRKEWFVPISAGVVLLISGMLQSYSTLIESATIIPLMTESISCTLAVWLFSAAVSLQEMEDERQEMRQKGGGLLLIGCFLLSLGRIYFLNGINLGRWIAAILVMTASYCGGVQAGGIAGIIAGTAVDLAAGGTPLFSMCYGIAGLLAGTIAKQGRLLFLLCFVSANAVGVFWQWSRSESVYALYEVFAASVIFMLLPSRILGVVVSYLQKPSLGAGEAGLRRYTARRAKDMANAFRELYETVRSHAESRSNDMDIATVYDRTAEMVCSACGKKGECWHRDYVDTLSMLNDATTSMKQKGCLEQSDLPNRFLDKCPSYEFFLDTVNHELRALIYRRRLKTRLRDNQTAAYGQFRYLASVLDAMAENLKHATGPDTVKERKILRYLHSKEIDAEVAVFRDHSSRLHISIDSPRLAGLYRDPLYMDRLSALAGTRMCRPAHVNQEEGRMVLLEAEPLAVSVGIAAVKKEGESVSGDRGTYFKTEQGVLCVLLSDGMGSGEEAAQESISVVRILERFLRAGVEPGTAMKILNSVMLLKSTDSWGYATVDLMCIDLFTGKTAFYKYGAAPSYVCHGKTIRRVNGISMAAGSIPGEGEPPDVVRIHLKPGGIALIASDGVVSRENDEWLRQMILDFDGLDTRDFARSVVREAGKQYGYSDDMTVLVVRVEERK